MEPITFISLVYDYIENLDGVTIEATDADPDTDEAIYSLRHPCGLLTDMRVANNPTLMEAQEWCLGFLGRPLHIIMAAAYAREVER